MNENINFPFAEVETEEMKSARLNDWSQKCPKCCHYKSDPSFKKDRVHSCGGFDGHSLVNCPSHNISKHGNELKKHQKEQKKKKLEEIINVASVKFLFF